MTYQVYTFLAAILLAVVHLFAGRFRSRLERVPRNGALSFAGGVSVSYVFVHVLPEFGEHQHHLQTVVDFEHAAFLAALAGLVLFYGLEMHAERTSKGEVFWLHIGSFALYNALVGSLLYGRAEGKGLVPLALYTTAMSLHFLVNDYGLLRHHQDQYHREGRWLLVLAIIGGWFAGRLLPLSETVHSFLFAFLGGAVILNVLKEELPSERESKFLYFFLGVVVYTALLLAL